MTTTTPTDKEEEVVASTPSSLREEAVERLKKQRDFKAHALVYVLVNAVVWGVWAVISAHSHSWWP